MISLKIGGNKYRIPETWADITIAQAAGVMAIPMPEALRTLYRVIVSRGELTEKEHEYKIQEANEQITPEQRYKEIPEYQLKVLSYLGNIPHEVLHKTSNISINTAYSMYLRHFVEGLHFYPVSYEPKVITSFTFEGVEYMLPKGKRVFGQEVPMADTTALEFTESADLMIGLTKMEKDFSKSANLLAIMCRPEGEMYDEETSLARAERFISLTMDKVWDVFFSLILPLIILNQYTQISSLQGIAEARHKREKAI